MTLDALLAAVAAIVSAALGVVLIVREFRRRDRRESMAEIAQLSEELHALRADMIAYRRWAYDLAVTLTGLGVTVPPAPAPRDEQ